ncbi:MAG: S46 family peptidase, partial [bacterium]
MAESIRSAQPVYPQLEEVRLAGAIDRATRHLGTQHAWVQTLLQAQPTAAQAARKVLAGTQLADAAERARLLDAKAFAASQDPLIQLARQLQPLRRQL